MLTLLTLLSVSGCGRSEPPRPADVPADAVRVWSDGQQLTVGAVSVPITELAQAPTEPTSPRLVQALQASAGKPLWVDLPADTPFWVVRQALNSGDEAGARPAWLSVRGDGAPEAFAVTPPPKFTIGGACDAPVPVTGVEPLVTVSVQTGPDGAWVLATARLIPETAQGPTELEADCLAVPTCDALFPEGAAREACAAQQAPAPQRVTLGGELGCLLPLAKQPGDVAAWRSGLAQRVEELGLGDTPLRVVMPEAMSRLDAVLAVVGGFVDAGLPPPSIGTQLLVEGNDGPPVCNAPVRDRASLELAGARWLGGMRAWAAASAPAPAPEEGDGG
ncbi:MAG: hypothetical protein R3F59_36805 [Myxococcota bacterium]